MVCYRGCIVYGHFYPLLNKKAFHGYYKFYMGNFTHVLRSNDAQLL